MDGIGRVERARYSDLAVFEALVNTVAYRATGFDHALSPPLLSLYLFKIGCHYLGVDTCHTAVV